MNTNSPLTFGKYSGWTPADLAKAGSSGRSYLSWGANNLKSPQWRQVFQDAWRRDDGALHSPENLKALIDWLQADKGFVWVIAADPDYYNDSLDGNFFRSLPHVWQPAAAQTNPEGLLALLEKRSP